MSENDMTAPTNPFEGLPLHHLLFLKIRDGGGAKVAHGVAEQHGISVDELKALCMIRLLDSSTLRMRVLNIRSRC